MHNAHFDKELTHRNNVHPDAHHIYSWTDCRRYPWSSNYRQIGGSHDRDLEFHAQLLVSRLTALGFLHSRAARA